MNILIVYESIEGHTEKIARKISEQIESANHQVILANAREPGAAIPGTQDGVIVCGPIHAGNYPTSLTQFVTSFSQALNDMPSALVTVSLAAAGQNQYELDEASTYPDALIKSSGWEPNLRYDAAGALKYLEYNFFKRYLMRYMVGEAGGPVDTSVDYEFTDWDALARFVAQFLETASGGSARHP